MTKASRDRFVIENLPLVKAIALGIRRTLPAHIDLDDLISAGIMGLIDAIPRFDPKKKVPLRTFVKHRIKGAILDSLRQLDWASRDMRRRHKQVEAAAGELADALGRKPTESEIADRLGIDVERYREMVADLLSVGLISACTRTAQYDELPAPEFPSNPVMRPDNVCLQGELRDGLLGALDVLPARYRKVVELYYRDDLTMKEIGELLGVKGSRVSQMHKFALATLRAKLEYSGVKSAGAFVAAA